MRHYVSNSSQAIARILALSMLIDGVDDEIEYRLIEENGSLAELGVSRAQVDQAMQAFYEDLDLGVSMSRTLDQRLTASDLSRLLGEITDPAIQQTLLQGMMRIAIANDQVSAGEARLIREALLQWTNDDGVGSFLLQPSGSVRPSRHMADRLN